MQCFKHFSLFDALNVYKKHQKGRLELRTKELTKILHTRGLHIYPLREFQEQNSRHFFSEQKSFSSSPAHIYCENMKPAEPMFAKCKCRQLYLAGEDSISILTKCISSNCSSYKSIFHNVFVYFNKGICRCLPDVNAGSCAWLGKIPSQY